MLKLTDSSEPPVTDDIHLKFDIRHTAPQHRTHLEYGGFGLVACASLKSIGDFILVLLLFVQHGNAESETNRLLQNACTTSTRKCL